jgi:tetratricopeptide (TPR) repeat protein
MLSFAGEGNMEKRPARFNKLFIIIPVITLALLVIGLYLAGLFSLPTTIETAYQGQDCLKVQSSYDLATRFYSGIVKDHPEFTDYSAECGSYLDAQSKDENQDWEAAYNAYRSYENTYPSGIKVDEAHERQANALVSWARQQADQKLYQEAIDHAKAVLADYGDTPSARDAEKLIADTYVTWAGEKRSGGDFGGAETLHNEFAAWAKENSKAEYIQLASQELARTLLEWGTNLAGKQEFTPAEVYLQRAIETAPDTEAGKEIATQAGVAMSKLHTDWGTSLLAKKDYENAAKHFEQASQSAANNEKASISELLTGVYVKWAEDLTDQKNFGEALEKIDRALETATTDAGKKAAEDAQQKTYTAFSNADNLEAREAMDSAAKILCEGKKADLPIFGIDPDKVGAYLYPGQNVSFSDDIQATTPGSMHYVACIVDVKNVLVKVSEYSGPQNRTVYLIEYKIMWKMALIEADSGEIVSENTFVGENPKVTDTNVYHYNPGYNAISGPIPSIAEIIAWIESTIRQIK